MKVRVWNAYASNNSGSYTIVGRLPSAEVAEEAAAALRSMIEAHTAWRTQWDGRSSTADSPLARFCRDQGLTWSEDVGGWGDWPEYGQDNRPRVVVSGVQLVVHHEYTVSLPPTFGEFLYKKGGRVEHEENHAHDPLVVTARFYEGWDEVSRTRQPVDFARLLEALTAADGVLSRGNDKGIPPAWRTGDGFHSASLTVGVIFDDVIEGVSQLRDMAKDFSATLELRLTEAEGSDPIGHLRPSMPALPRFDVLVTATGNNRPRIVETLAKLTGVPERDVRERLQQSVPILVAKSLPELKAKTLLAAIEGAGAEGSLRRNDG